jgi:hypothetical protein
LRAEPVSALYERGLVHHVGRFAMLEDQLCAFTTQGYRGEGSPDHADALVFAVTELMLKDNASILEFYRLQAGERQRQQKRGHGADGERIVRLQAPVDASTVHGLSGTLYIVDIYSRRCAHPCGQARGCGRVACRGFYPCRRRQRLTQASLPLVPS